MSKIKTTTSTTRPPDAAPGELFFETDTNRLIFWDGSKYHVYNRDSLIQTTGGTEELHYPQGIYADSSATYYISQSPMLHFDTSHMNGVDKTQMYAHGVWAEHWYDRTQNNYLYTDDTFVATSYIKAEMDLNQSSLMSGNTNTLPCIWNDGGAKYTPPVGAPTSITGDVTTFFVMQPHSGSFVSPGPNGSWYTNNAGTYFHMGANFAANLGSVPDAAWTNTGETNWSGWRTTVDATTGPGLYIARNSDSGNQVWRPDTRGNHVPITVGKSLTSGNLSYILHGYDMFAWEIMFFDSALTIEEVNKVKSYLQNKYEGLHAAFFPTGGTIDLTE